MYFLNRIKPEYAEDKDGFYPNLQFKKEYYEKYWKKARQATICAQPQFINGYLEKVLS